MSIAKAFLATVLYFIVIGLTDIPYIVWIFSTDDFSTAEYFLLASGLLMTVLMVLFIGRQYGFKEGLTPKKTAFYFYLVAFIVGGTYVFVQAFLNIPYDLIAGIEYTIEFNVSLERFKHVNVIRTLLFIPIAEELFFRHYLQRKLQVQYKAYLAIVVSSLLFASIHLPFEAIVGSLYEWDFHHAYIALFGGLLSGILYFKSKSIGPSILFHIMWNLGTTIF